jgi:hypothetical protein
MKKSSRSAELTSACDFSSIRLLDESLHVPTTLAELVDGWIRNDQRMRLKPRPEDDDFPDWWAWAVVDYLCDRQPACALAFVVEALSRDLSEAVHASLAAGALEDILARHGAAVIEMVEGLAARYQHFRHCLAGVWQNRIPDDIWERIQRARGAVW